MSTSNRTTFFYLMGLALILTGGVLASGAVPGPWTSSVTTKRWKAAEVHAIIVPSSLPIGAELKTVTFTAYNGHETSGDLLFNVWAEGYLACQFTVRVASMSEEDETVTMYREPLIMGVDGLTIHVQDGFLNTHLTTFILPGSENNETPEPPEPPQDNPGDTTGVEDPTPDPVPAFFFFVRQYAPLATIQSLVLGSIIALGGMGVMIYGVSSRWSE